jgi:hypothetical protein
MNIMTPMKMGTLRPMESEVDHRPFVPRTIPGSTWRRPVEHRCGALRRGPCLFQAKLESILSTDSATREIISAIKQWIRQTPGLSLRAEYQLLTWAWSFCVWFTQGEVLVLESKKPADQKMRFILSFGKKVCMENHTHRSGGGRNHSRLPQGVFNKPTPIVRKRW